MLCSDELYVAGYMRYCTVEPAEQGNEDISLSISLPISWQSKSLIPGSALIFQRFQSMANIGAKDN
jgi:hypothetical protein